MTSWTCKQFCISWALQEIAPFTKKWVQLNLTLHKIAGFCCFANFGITLSALQWGLIEETTTSLKGVVCWLKFPLKVDYLFWLRNNFVIKFANYVSSRHFTCLLFCLLLTWDEKCPVLCLGNMVIIFATRIPTWFDFFAYNNWIKEWDGERVENCYLWFEVYMK